LLSGTVQYQYAGGSARPRKVLAGPLLVARGQKMEQMYGDEKHFIAIPHSTHDPPRKLQWHWTHLSLSVVPVQLAQKGK